MEKKKKINYFKIIFSLLFITYMALYALNASGYYDGNMRRKVEFTESQIKQFEQDVQDGKIVDIEDYLEDQTKDYSNKASRLGYKISSNVDKFLNIGIKDILKILGKLLS